MIFRLQSENCLLSNLKSNLIQVQDLSKKTAWSKILIRIRLHCIKQLLVVTRFCLLPKIQICHHQVPKNQAQREYEIATLLSQITLIAVRFPIISAPIDSRIQRVKKFFGGGFVLFLLCFLEAAFLFGSRKVWSFVGHPAIWKICFTPLHEAAFVGHPATGCIRNVWTPFHLAVKAGHLNFCVFIQLFSQLLQDGTKMVKNFDSQNGHQKTWASSYRACFKHWVWNHTKK